MREEERKAQRAAARAERRTRRAAEQAAQNVPQKAEAPKAPRKAGVPHKKKKINKFRVAVVCTAAVLVALVALGVASAAGVRTPISSIAADGEPEFFSTVNRRPALHRQKTPLPPRLRRLPLSTARFSSATA